MKIIEIDINIIEPLITSFISSYDEWSYENAEKYLTNSIKACPDFCFISTTDENVITGGIFCKLSTGPKGDLLMVEALQIIEKYRNQKIGRELLLKVSEKAKECKINTISLLCPDNNEFPKNWYSKIGFSKTGWVEMFTHTDTILNKI